MILVKWFYKMVMLDDITVKKIVYSISVKRFIILVLKKSLWYGIR